MRRLLKAGALSVLLLTGLSLASLGMQGPASAQIQAALRSFVASPQTITGAWTFTTAPTGTTFLCQATVTLTDAQIKALPTTGVIVVPAQGAGMRVMLATATGIFDATAGPYETVNAAALLTLSLESSGGTRISSGPSTASDMLQDDGDIYVYDYLPVADVVGDEVLAQFGWLPLSGAGGVTNTPIYVTASNASDGPFTGGNAANTLTVSVAYYVLNTVTGQFAACPAS